MTHIKGRIVLAVGVWLVLYGIGAVTTLSWSLSAWDPAGRCLAVVLAIVGTMAALGADWAEDSSD